MIGRDQFEHRLGRGLKRWAEAGQPSIDLEAYVRGHETSPEPGPDEPSVPPRRRPRWAAGVAVAAALLVTLAATFPTWAGAAAGWPLVGPIVTELFLKDSSLKWAYENGLIHGTLAEAKEGDVTVRILGVLANSWRTTIFYQVTGLSASDKQPRPSMTKEEVLLTRPKQDVEIGIAKVDGRGASWWWTAPEETRVGLVGSIYTLPLETDEATIELKVRIYDQVFTFEVEASRAEADRFSREVLVDQSQEIDGIKVTVEAVIYTPAETVVRYREESPSFGGPVGLDPDTEFIYVEHAGVRYPSTGGAMATINGGTYAAFPRFDGPVTLVFPVMIKGVEADLVWPLEPGQIQKVRDVVITLTSWSRIGDAIDLTWESGVDEHFVGIGQFEVLDAEGHSYTLGHQTWSSQGNNLIPPDTLLREYRSPLPEGVNPVAVRATRVGHRVVGPWRFDLPR